MKNYNVNQIAEMLHTNPETVRRWIRNGKLHSTMTSTKSGNVISQESLDNFLKATPKYAAVLATTFLTSPMALSMAVGGLLAGLVKYKSKDRKISDKEIKSIIEEKIEKSKKNISDKTKEIENLKKEISEEKINLEKYKYILKNFDLNTIAKEFNNGK